MTQVIMDLRVEPCIPGQIAFLRGPTSPLSEVHGCPARVVSASFPWASGSSQQ